MNTLLKSILFGNHRVIAVVQLINKQGGVITEASPAGCDSAAGRHFTEQDLVVIEAFLSLLGPQIFTSSMVQFKRKMHIKVRLSPSTERGLMISRRSYYSTQESRVIRRK